MRTHTLVLAIAFFAASSLPAANPTEFNTYIGDSNSTYHVARLRSDAAGNTYVAGTRTTGALSEVFVAKLDPSGIITAFTTLSGKGSDTVADMAIDAAGNIYLAGSTSSTHFPLRAALQSTPGPGFLAKLGPDAGPLLYATYFPAPVAALALDTAGNLYVTGSTNSATFPVTAGLPAGPASTSTYGAFIAKIAAAGDRILYSTVLVGHAKNCGCCSSCFTSTRSTGGAAIAVDAAGNAYVAGNTDTYDLPTTTGAMTPQGPGAFVAKINAAGSALAYLTYIGSTYYPISPNTNPANRATSIAADSDGFAYVAGSTFDPHFPATPGALQTTFAGPAYANGVADQHPLPAADAFVLKLKPDGSGAAWATYLGGAGEDATQSIALDSAGAIWLAGVTASSDFPNQQGWSNGGDFLAAFSAAGALRYAARYPTGSVSQSIAPDPAGMLHAAGPSGLVAAIAPVSSPATHIFGIANAAWGAAGGQLAPGLISIYGAHIGPSNAVVATATNSTLPATLGGVTVSVNGKALPLLYVSDSQINAVLPPFEATADLHIANNSSVSPAFPIASLSAAPQIFRNASGAAAAVNEDGTLNSPDHPAKAGSIVAVWATGISSSYTYTYDGTIATAARNYYCCQVYTPIAADPLDVLYSGDAPGAAKGVVQINFRVPAVAIGDLAVSVVSDTGRSDPATIYTAM